VGKGKRADVYLEVRKRRGHIFFEWNKCLWMHILYFWNLQHITTISAAASCNINTIINLWPLLSLNVSNFFLANRISGVMVSLIALSVVGRGFKPWSGQTKDYEIGICCFSAMHAALRRKSKDWLARNQDNV
jgi:hypothetical protein